METLRPILGAFVAWPTDVLRPSVSLLKRPFYHVPHKEGVAGTAG